LIGPTFEDVIVQNEPDAPVYREHSLIAWRFPLCSENAHTEGRS
jgi:hypothetical protein